MDTKAKVVVGAVAVTLLAGVAWALTRPVTKTTTSTTNPSDTVSLSLSTSTTNLTVTLTATATSSIGATTTINSIDWGDGNSASNSASPAVHTYSSAGTYTITVKASDANVPTVSATTSVTATAPVTTTTTPPSTGNTNPPPTGQTPGTSTLLGDISSPFSGSVQTGGPNYNWQGAGYYMFGTYGPVSVQTQSIFDSYENALAKLGSIPSDIVIGNEDGSWSDEKYPYQPTVMTLSAVQYLGLTWNGTGWYNMGSAPYSTHVTAQSTITDFDTAQYNAAKAGTINPNTGTNPTSTAILSNSGGNQLVAGSVVTFNVSGLTANSTWKLWVCPIYTSGGNQGTPIMPIVPSLALTAAQSLSGTGSGSMIYDVTVGSPFYNNIDMAIKPNTIAVVAVDAAGKMTNALVFNYS